MAQHFPQSSQSGCKQCVEQHASCTGGTPDCSRCRRLLLTCEYSASKISGVYATPQNFFGQHQNALSNQHRESFLQSDSFYAGLHSVPNSPRFTEYAAPGQYTAATSLNLGPGYNLPSIRSYMNEFPPAPNASESRPAPLLGQQSSQNTYSYQNTTANSSWRQHSYAETRNPTPSGLSFYAPSSPVSYPLQSWAQNQSLVEQREYPRKLAEGAGRMGSTHWPFNSRRNSPQGNNVQNGHVKQMCVPPPQTPEPFNNSTMDSLPEVARQNIVIPREVIATLHQAQVAAGAPGNKKGMGTSGAFHSGIQSRPRSPSPGPHEKPPKAPYTRTNGNSQPSSSDNSQKRGGSSDSSSSHGASSDSHSRSYTTSSFFGCVLNESPYEPPLKKAKVCHDNESPVQDGHFPESHLDAESNHDTAAKKTSCQACDRCYASKIKCTRGLPRCSRCAERGISCAYSRTGLKKTRRVKLPIISSIRARILVFRSNNAPRRKLPLHPRKPAAVPPLQQGESVLDLKITMPNRPDPLPQVHP